MPPIIIIILKMQKQFGAKNSATSQTNQQRSAASSNSLRDGFLSNSANKNENQDLVPIKMLSVQEKNIGGAGKNFTKDDANPIFMKEKQRRICFVCQKSTKSIKIRKCLKCSLWIHIRCFPASCNMSETDYHQKGVLCSNCGQNKSVNIQGPSNLQEKSKIFNIQLAPIKLKKKQKQNLAMKKEMLAQEQHSSSFNQSSNFYLKVKQFNDFKKCYPLYVSSSPKQSIKFPIRDQLIQNYKQLFSSNKQFPEMTQDPKIPPIHLHNMLYIENYCMSLQTEEDYPCGLNKYILYKSFQQPGNDKYFIFVLSSILKLYVEEVLKNKKSIKNKSQMETFFQLRTYFNSFQESYKILTVMWKEVVKYLSTISSFSHLFETKLQNFNTESKIKFITELIEGLCQVETYRNHIQNLQNQLMNSKQRANARQDQIDKLLEQDQQQADYYSRVIADYEAQIQRLRRKLMKGMRTDEISYWNKHIQNVENTLRYAQKQKKQLYQEIKLNKRRLTQIFRSQVFTIDSLKYIGSDRNYAQYFINYQQPSKLFVNIKPSTMYQTPEIKVISGFGKIKQLVECLNQNGSRERLLCEQIKEYIKIRMLHEQQEESQFSSSEDSGILKGKLLYVSLSDVSECILQYQRQCTEYHKPAGFVWGDILERAKFEQNTREIIYQENNEAIQSLKKAIDYIYEKSKKAYQLIPKRGQDKQIRRLVIWNRSWKGLRKAWQLYKDNIGSVEEAWLAIKIVNNVMKEYITKKNSKIALIKNKANKYQKENQVKMESQMLCEIGDDCANIVSNSFDHEAKNKNKTRKVNRNKHFNTPNLQISEQEDQSDEQFDIDSLVILSNKRQVKKCASCNQKQTTVSCDDCSNGFHLKCLNIGHVDSMVEWSCPICKCENRIKIK